MELLQPHHPSHLAPIPDPLHGLRSPSRFSSPETPEVGRIEEKLFVAVGKKIDKTLILLPWCFKQFGGCEFCLLHIHKPSPLIPTLLGKLPVSQANSEMVNAHRVEEKAKMRNLLDIYLRTCAQNKVKASVLVIEDDLVPRGIIELVNIHCIKKLVMGAVPASCMKMRSASKVDYVSKKAPPFCEIWFVIKGKHSWVREAFETSYVVSHINGAEPQVSRARSFGLSKSNLSFTLKNMRSRSNRNLFSSEISSQVEADKFDTEMSMFASCQCDMSSTRIGVYDSVPEEKSLSSHSCSGFGKDCLYSQLNESRTDAEISKHEAFWEVLKCKKLELEVMEAVKKVKVLESAHACQIKLRENAETELRSIIKQQEKHLEVKEKLSRKLQRTMSNVVLLDSHTKRGTRSCNEVSTKLKLMELSIAELRMEKQKIQRQKLEANRWIERWKTNGKAGSLKCSESVGISGEDMLELAEFSFSELEAATFDFSESFKLGQGGNGCVYKGEMMGRTVAIKRLHPHNMQGQQEFQQEVRVLSKLQHPHLVTLLGYCPEAWSLVYEYLPNGSLQDQLFRKTNISHLSWEIRIRIIAEISSALCFLHSLKPKRIVHGDLKPENILLDSKFTCKLSDFGISRLVFDVDEAFNPPNGVFPYTDPEIHRFGFLTPKSDIYSFGIIILQLLTRQPPFGLVGQVRKAMSLGKLASILDIKAGEWPILVAEQLAKIGLQCCEPHSTDRPGLTPSLVRELEQLLAPEEQAVPSFYLCPILQEIMHDPQIAEDGFTYEGEAIRSWFRNGHDTSPMTNLKLSRLHLTPNHALRLAIQDWLCKS